MNDRQGPPHLMSNLAIIPARGGSKRIPRKNIKLFYGKPIIAYSIQAALDSGVFAEVMVSTDDDEIADLAVQYGARVPFRRSPELSTDMAMVAPVLVEVIQEYRKSNRFFNYMCCIFPTAPLVSAQRIRLAMDLLIKTNVDGILPVVRYSYPPQRALVIKDHRVQMIHWENYNVRSQDFEPIYHDCAQFYCLNTSSLLEQQKLFCANTIPMELPESEVQDIDNLEDWIVAEYKYGFLHRKA
jgi:pseudaminic acid cytidylyltransferase